MKALAQQNTWSLGNAGRCTQLSIAYPDPMSEKKLSLVKAEREELANLLAELGPNQPTLCSGWETQDLLANLVTRERRPDSAAGVVIPALKSWRAKVEATYAAKDYLNLVQDFRSGPTLLSPFAIPFVDNMANLIQFVIHHEDVRRGNPNWVARTGIAELQSEIKKRLPKFAFLALRKSAVGVVMIDHESTQYWLKRGGAVVELRGEPIEILLYLTGRQVNANVTVQGSPAALATFERMKFGF